MRDLLRTNDPVLVSFVEALLRDAGIECHVADANMSILEGSIGVFPRRILVAEGTLGEARQLLADAGLEAHLYDDGTSAAARSGPVDGAEGKAEILGALSETTPPPDVTDDAILGGRLAIQQPRTGFRVGVDAVLLAAAAPGESDRPLRVLDAGAGVGVAGLCFARRVPTATVTLLERFPELAALARHNASRNDLADRVSVVEADLLDTPARLEAQGLQSNAFDLALANPPWMEEGRGRRSQDAIKAGANAMPESDLDGWLRFLARVVAPGGTLVMVHRADALDRVLAALQGRFGGAEILPLHPRAGQPANRIIVRTTKGSRAPLAVLAGLVLHDDRGFRAPIDAILRTGAALDWPDGR